MNINMKTKKGLGLVTSPHQVANISKSFLSLLTPQLANFANLIQRDI